MKRGQIYFADLRPVIGSEQGGIRPCVIIQNDMGNYHSPTVIVAMLATQRKKDLPTHVSVSEEDYCVDINTTILLEQIRTIDKSRLQGFVGRLSDGTMRRVDEALHISLALNKEEREVEKMAEEENTLENKEVPSNWKSVYIMQSDSGQIKIGISKNVKKRKKSLENSGFMKITNYYKTRPCSNPFEIERAMHKHFEKFRLRGEWFSCEAGDAITVLDNVFSEMAKFDVKNYDLTSLQSIVEDRVRRRIEEQEYVKSLEKNSGCITALRKEEG